MEERIGVVLLMRYFAKRTVSVKLGKLSVGSAKLAKSGVDDLLSSIDGGKHDYDWYVSRDSLFFVNYSFSDLLHS